MAIDYINTLGAGAGFNTKEIVSALVDAETVPTQSRLQTKIDDNNAKVSALADAAASLSLLETAANALNDASDFNSYGVSNNQTSAFGVTASSEAAEGNHSITVSAVAREQRSTLVPHGGSGFSSKTQLLNSGSAFNIAIEVGDSSTVTTTVSVSTATPQGIVDAINAADIEVTAQLVDQGTTGDNYIIQMTGASGTDNQFTVTPSVNSLLTHATPSGQAAANAALVVNGISVSRSTNTITDVIPGLTLSLNGVTTGAASASVTRDTSGVKTHITDLINQFNSTKDKLDSLTNRELEGALAGDSIFRSNVREMQNYFTAFSSTPGTLLRGLSDMGISITRQGNLEIAEATLNDALAVNFEDIRTVFSAGTNDQTDIGIASRGIAGDLSKFVGDLSNSTGYFTTQTEMLDEDTAKQQVRLTDLDDKIESLTERYTRQFATMNKIIDEMNNTKDNLISSFENLPFTAKK